MSQMTDLITKLGVQKRKLCTALNRFLPLSKQLDVENATIDDVVNTVENITVENELIRKFIEMNEYDIIDNEGIITAIPSYRFYYDKGLRNLILGNENTTIQSEAFNGCSIKSAKINSLDFPYPSAFYGASNITNISLPKVRHINTNYLFYKCKALKCVTFNKQGNLNFSLYGYSLTYADALVAFIFPSKDSVATLPSSYGDLISKAGLFIYVPSSMLDSYVADTYWAEINAKREIKTIEDNYNYLVDLGADLDDYILETI